MAKTSMKIKQSKKAKFSTQEYTVVEFADVRTLI